MKKRKKILVFAQSGVGGAERMSVTISKSLDRDRFEVKYYLIGHSKKSSAPLADFIPKDLAVCQINFNNPICLIFAFFWIILVEKPNLVFASVINLNNKLLLLKSLFKHTKFIVRCDNYLYTYTEKQKRIIDNTYFRADLIIAQTDEMKHELIDEMCINSAKVVVLHNPIDIETIDRKIQNDVNPYNSSDIVNYVAVGRFAFQKGFDLLIHAFAEVKNTYTNANLYIVGKNDGNCEAFYNEVITLIKLYKLEDSVHCVGYQKNPYSYLKYADCFVLSSRWEGLPNVLIESQYLGTPAAAFKCIPIIQRIITDGVTGYCADKESPSSLADAMIRAINLGRVNYTYHSASVNDFETIFEQNS